MSLLVRDKPKISGASAIFDNINFAQLKASWQRDLSTDVTSRVLFSMIIRSSTAMKSDSKLEDLNLPLKARSRFSSHALLLFSTEVNGKAPLIDSERGESQFRTRYNAHASQQRKNDTMCVSAKLLMARGKASGVCDSGCGKLIVAVFGGIFNKIAKIDSWQT